MLASWPADAWCVVLVAFCAPEVTLSPPAGRHIARNLAKPCRRKTVMHADRAERQVALLTYVVRRLWAWLLALDAKSVQHPAEHHFEDPSSLKKASQSFALLLWHACKHDVMSCGLHARRASTMTLQSGFTAELAACPRPDLRLHVGRSRRRPYSASRRRRCRWWCRRTTRRSA